MLARKNHTTLVADSVAEVITRRRLMSEAREILVEAYARTTFADPDIQLRILAEAVDDAAAILAIEMESR